MDEDLDAAQAKLRETSAVADDTQGHVDGVGRGDDGDEVGTQALADMLGPLGDVSGAASEAGSSGRRDRPVCGGGGGEGRS